MLLRFPIEAGSTDSFEEAYARILATQQAIAQKYPEHPIHIEWGPLGQGPYTLLVPFPEQSFSAETGAVPPTQGTPACFSPTENGLFKGLLQTLDHQFLFQQAGMHIFQAGEDVDEASDVLELPCGDLLAIAAYVQAHREAFLQAHQALEHIWRSVAEEVMNRLEAKEPGGAREATGEAIQQLLHELGPISLNDKRGVAQSFAGRWYQSLWVPSEGCPSSFGLQWVPFLRTFHQRRLERFPDLAEEGTENEPD